MPQTDLARETLLAYAAVCDTRATGTCGTPPWADATQMPLVLWDRRGLRHLVNVVISYLSFGQVMAMLVK